MNAITGMYFHFGKLAFNAGEVFCESESYAWKQGWKAAQKEGGQ